MRTLFLLLALCPLCHGQPFSFSSQSFLARDSTLLNGIVSHWSLQESFDPRANDVAGGKEMWSITNAYPTNGIFGPCIRIGSPNTYLAATNSPELQFGNTNWTIALWCLLENTNNCVLVGKDRTGQRELNIYGNSSFTGGRMSAEVFVAGTVSTVLTNVVALTSNVWHFVCLRHNVATKTLTLQSDGNTSTNLVYTNTLNSGTEPLCLGGRTFNTATNSISGALSEVTKWNRCLSDAEVAQAYNQGLGGWWMGYSERNRRKPILCVFDGDSITMGQPGHDSRDFYPPQTMAQMGKAYWATNAGDGGKTAFFLNGSARAGRIDTLLSTVDHDGNIDIAFMGTNDLFFGTNATNAYLNIKAYCHNRQLNAWKVAVLTILPRSDAGTPGSFEADRQTVNTTIRANYTNFADVLIDVGNDPNIGQAGQETNTTYYADLVHLTPTGYGVIASYVRPVIGAFYKINP